MSEQCGTKSPNLDRDYYCGLNVHDDTIPHGEWVEHAPIKREYGVMDMSTGAVVKYRNYFAARSAAESMPDLPARLVAREVPKWELV